MSIVPIFKKQHKDQLSNILAGCKRGDPRSQEMLFKSFAKEILTTCRRYENRHQGAKDMLQETFITVFDKLDQFDPDRGSFGAWVNRIAVNIALKGLRKQPKIIGTPDHLDLIEETVDDLSLHQFSEEELLAQIHQLPKGYRTVFNLFVLDDFSHQEIADHLNISVQTSKSQLSKARAMLRRQLSAKKKAQTPSTKLTNLSSHV
ncbi:MAG: sigma-70 family RNA polymerase sigma factor [Bacteroidota bacterium]